MKKEICFLWLLLTINFVSMGQTLEKIWETDSVLKVPESVILDAKNQRLYVSNIDGKNAWEKDGKGSVALLTLSGRVFNPVWVTGLHAPKGMSMFQDFLIVADVDSVVIIDVIKGQVIKKIFVEGAKALNDLVCDKRGNMYVTDSKENKVFFIDAVKLKPELYLEGLTGVNGVTLFEKTLYIVDAGTLYRIGKDKEKIKIADGMEGRTDGVEAIDENTFIVSCWEGAIWWVKSNGEKKLLWDAKKEGYNTADIGIDKKTQTLYVPTFWRNTVRAFKW
ncbi:MAG: ATP/GTP-binding protein [Chitinophagia bacterium]|nr:ATP/GTP-binding protein [Chitinophagia bacterium]